MKAAILESFGKPLAIAEMPDPTPGTGEILVNVAATGVLPYAAEVFSGRRRYQLVLPLVPGTGAVGRIAAVGPDATRLSPGDWVFCDPTVRSRDDALTPDMLLQGWSARGDGGLRLQRHFRHGGFAERMLIPTENAVPLGAVDPAGADRWCALAVALVPYGGLLAARLQPGETVLISGATGNFGSAGVAVALAMGAGRVVAPGRNEAMLTLLAHRFGPRLRPVRLTGDEAEDRARMQAAAGGPVDCVLDILPPQASPTAVRAAAMTVREHGRVALMGGVGMLGGDDLALPYPWLMRNGITVVGQWMYPRTANGALVRMAAAGLLDLGGWDVTPFALDDVNDAIADAAANGGPFRLTTIRP